MISNVTNVPPPHWLIAPLQPNNCVLASAPRNGGRLLSVATCLCLRRRTALAPSIKGGVRLLSLLFMRWDSGWYSALSGAKYSTWPELMKSSHPVEDSVIIHVGFKDTFPSNCMTCFTPLFIHIMRLKLHLYFLTNSHNCCTRLLILNPVWPVSVLSMAVVNVFWARGNNFPSDGLLPNKTGARMPAANLGF